MTFEIINITPEMARMMLNQNKNNRKLRKGTVALYAQDMLSNKWEVTAQGIVFDADGNLLDGQHRLNAVIAADTTVKMLVIHGAPSAKVYDIGLKRNASDVLFFKDSKNSGFMYSSYGLAVIRNVMNSFARKTVSVQAIEQYIEQNKEYLDLFFTEGIFVTGSRTEKGLRSSYVCSALYCAYRNGISLDQIRRFYKVFTEGFSTDPNEYVIIALRNKFLRDYKSMTDHEKARRTMWSLNKFIIKEGETTTSRCPEDFIYAV